MSDARKKPTFGRAGKDSTQIHNQMSGSKEQLQDELTDFFFQADEEAFSGKKLDALLYALDEADPLPECGAFDTEKSLEQFHEKYAPVFSSLETKPAAVSVSSTDKKHSHNALFKIFPIAAVLVLLFGSVTCQALGLDVFGTIARWTSEIFQLGNSSTPYATIQTNPLSEGEAAYYNTLEEAVDAFGVTSPIVPKWIPNQFELVRVWATKQSTGTLICADYTSEDGYLQIRYKEMKNGDFSSVERENGEMEIYSNNAITHYLLFDMDRQKAYWQNGEMECQIVGNITRQEMKDIIDSIYKGE